MRGPVGLKAWFKISWEDKTTGNILRARSWEMKARMESCYCDLLQCAINGCIVLSMPIAAPRYRTIRYDAPIAMQLLK